MTQDKDKKVDAQIFEGLRSLTMSQFPKICKNCDRIYESEDQYFFETKSISETNTGLKASEDDDGKAIVELFRNCVCGSTLMDFFSDRRDVSEAGLRRRKKFGEVLEFLVEKGLDIDIAKAELLKLVRGGESEILAKYKTKK